MELRTIHGRTVAELRRVRVYVAGVPGGRTVKIGRSKHLSRRLAELRSKYREPCLAMLWSFPSGAVAEKDLHDEFDDLRRGGEWFTFPDDADPVRLVKDAARRLGYLDLPSWLEPPPRAVRMANRATAGVERPKPWVWIA